MKRRALVRHLRRHDCYFIREGGRHSQWGKMHIGVQVSTAVPRHNEIGKWLVEKICKDLKIPPP